ncbi:MAG: ferritin-like domain-containing protein [Actinomycetota bacterium]
MTLNSFDRRVFLKGTAATIPAAVALQMLGGRWAFAQGADFENDVEVLNFALTLEYLESEFYKQGNGKNLLPDDAEAKLLNQIGADEDAHVKTLSQTIKDLGGEPVKAPKVDFSGAFKNRKSYLELSHTLENTGVGAYLGAAGFIEDKAILQAAAGIFGVEARHAAVVGDLLGLPVEGGVFLGVTETPIAKDVVLDAVTPFLK